MKKTALVLWLATCLQVPASVLLFADNFNTPDTTNFDGAPTDGRLSGLAAAATKLSSFASQQDINANRLDLDAAGGVRFGGETTRFNWAGAETGAEILGAGGFVVRFDWTFGTESTEWIGWKVGTPNADSGVNVTGVDHALLLRQNGNNERWDNNNNLGNSGISFNPTPNVTTTYPVELTYLFDSFADGSQVSLTARVNGIQIVNDTFTWDGNGGAVHMELQSGIEGNFIDNLSISTVPEPSSALLAGAAGLLTVARRRRR